MIEDRFTQKDLFRMGFTKKMIKTMLPAPELKTFDFTKYYMSKYQIKLWKQSDVDKIVALPRFKSLVERKAVYNEIARNSAKTKRENAKKKIDDVTSRIVVGDNIPLDFISLSQIRNNNTNYNQLLKEIKGLVGADELRKALFCEVNNKIAEKAPWLAGMCFVENERYYIDLYKRKRIIENYIRRRRRWL